MTPPVDSQPRSETAGGSPGFKLPRAARLLKQHEFRRVYGRGARAHGNCLVVVGWHRRSPGHRLGVSVSKQHGCAVRRNKIKRLLREAFRLERPGLPGRFDLILIPRPSESKYRLEQLRDELTRLVAKLASGKRPGQSRRRRGRGQRP